MKERSALEQTGHPPAKLRIWPVQVSLEGAPRKTIIAPEKRVRNVSASTGRTMIYKKPWDERTWQAIDGVQAVIKAAFPEAEFQVHGGGDPEGIYIDAYTKTENRFDVLNLIGDGLVDLGVKEGLGIYVVPPLKAEP
jgi:hypothetical protein